MRNKSLSDAYDSEVSLTHTKGCSCESCQVAINPQAYSQALENQAEKNSGLSVGQDAKTPSFSSADDGSRDRKYYCARALQSG